MGWTGSYFKLVLPEHLAVITNNRELTPFMEQKGSMKRCCGVNCIQFPVRVMRRHDLTNKKTKTKTMMTMMAMRPMMKI